MIKESGWTAPALFIFIYCLASLLFLPTMPLTFAGGAIFGPLTGTILNLLGATFGAACSFLITRYWAYEWLAQKKGTKLARLMSEVDKKGWGLVAFLRLFPILPFNLVNYGLGVTQIRFRTYLIITFVFLIPTEIFYTYLGYAGIELFTHLNHWYKNITLTLIGISLLVFFVVKKTRF